MKKIAISQLLPGMVTAESVLDINKQLIIEKGTLLKESHIRRLQSYNILAVCVEIPLSPRIWRNSRNRIRKKRRT